MRQNCGDLLQPGGDIEAFGDVLVWNAVESQRAERRRTHALQTAGAAAIRTRPFPPGHQPGGCSGCDRTCAGPEDVTDGAGRSRFRRLRASRLPRWWCSRTTSPAGGRGRGGVGDLDPPGVSDGAEHRLLVVPANPAHLEVPAERVGSGRSDPAVDQDQIEPPGDALSAQVLQHQLTGPVLVGGSWHDQRTDREPGQIERHHTLGALSAAVGTTAVVVGEPAVGRPAGKVCL